MQPDKKKLQSISDRTGFRINALEKVLRLLEILKDVFKHPLLSEVLVLKGGTALNLFYGPPRRLSVDLDFNYVGHIDKEEMLSQRGEVERVIENICRSPGYSLQKSKYSHAGRKFYLGFLNTSDTRDRIEIDINFLHRQLLLPYTELQSWPFDKGKRYSARVVSYEELVAGKICAALDRTSTRDLYDVLRLTGIEGEKWKSTLLRKIVITYSGTLPKPLYNYTFEVVMRRISKDQFKRILEPMLIQDERVQVEFMKTKSWNVLKRFVTLTEQEKEFINWLHKGEIVPELLFPDDEQMRKKLLLNPPLLWKVMNAKRHN